MTLPSSAPGRPGLAAAVYTASQCPSVIVLDKYVIGGQAGASARIENYLGFASDNRGFIRTGAEINGEPSLPFQTSMKGVFAIGDVRSGSTKRIASAVGEGAAVGAQIHAAPAATVRLHATTWRPQAIPFSGRQG